jgi:hypothetical protein
MKERPCKIKPEDNEGHTPVFSKEEIKKFVSGTIMKIKSSSPGFEGYDFGHLHLSTVCSTERRAGSVEAARFEGILVENEVDVMCKICSDYSGSN